MQTESECIQLAERDACGVGFIYRPQASHLVVSEALLALSRMEHRGACSADSVSADGAGVMTAIPWKLFQSEGWRLEDTAAGRKVAVIVCFLPRHNSENCKSISESIITEHGFSVIGWRKVPTNCHILGTLAKRTCPSIEQLFVAVPFGWSDSRIDARLTIARKRLINYVWQLMKSDEFYVASASTRTIVYKAMVKSQALGWYYPDLQEPSYESQWAVFHRRFSTNTVPKWRLSQPFRLLAHNGEINTLLGNRNWIAARQKAANHHGQPLVYNGSSDSANLDNVLEFHINSGDAPEEALMKLIPEAVPGALGELEGDELRLAQFYEFHAAQQEPWDGPALIVYSDGRTLGAALDRNGLRPARYTRLADGAVILGSEAGIVDVPQSEVVAKGRLGPGQMLSIDLATGTFRENAEIKTVVANAKPYGEMLAESRVELPCQKFDQVEAIFSEQEREQRQIKCGFSSEDVDHLLKAMITTGGEMVFSMGDDSALACLSPKPRIIYDYFKQRFAQVTNPPIDYLREGLVMNLSVYLRSANESVIKLDSPFLSESRLKRLAGGFEGISAVELPLTYRADEERLADALEALAGSTLKAAREGASLIILTDRNAQAGDLCVPALVAVGKLHHLLIDEGLRTDCSIIVETSQCWTVHHFACLLSYGAQAICPYLALDTVRAMAADGTGSIDRQESYQQAIESGLLKIISKMGISTLGSYIGAQIMECVGLGPQLVKECFAGTYSPIGGLELKEIEADMKRFYSNARVSTNGLANLGHLKARQDGELHGNNAEVVKALHAGMNTDVSSEERRSRFIAYANLVKGRAPMAVRDLLQFKSDRKPVSRDAVESAGAIARRFCTGGMSLGALSKEAHEVMAIAMNRLGGRSNSGEGGEDPNRYYPIGEIGADGTSPHFPGLTGLQDGDRASSAIRQVASARFGVTPEYLVTADQLEIKMAQGAKPGEGGQLPGAKVSEYIAKLRRAKPGTTLISPPPHHDIYSIEDLAQLIYDLRQVNPHAKISVKLVSESGIGTVASGVAKAGADIIQVSGHDGGTGAAPISSIKHAGMPWEFGLAEAHRALVSNGLRGRVQLRVDGGLRTGWDVVTAAMLGADEFGFGSIALIAEGCIMARVCHTNKCPVGITTQLESLRRKFRATPDQIVQFFTFIAEEVRSQLAELGFSALEDVVGRHDLLRARTDIKQRTGTSFDLDILMAPLSVPDQFPASGEPYKVSMPALDDHIAEDGSIIDAIENHGQIERLYRISNTDRAIGARIAGAIARRWGDNGFEGALTLRFHGAAGQSFGAFVLNGMHLMLEGEANDYVGKSMAGGMIAIRPHGEAQFEASENVIVGNTCLYGATGGAVYVRGRAGERFAVRNSNAVAVIEGAGDHCCEYMTGGTVVVLGSTGRNFGAGMTGGTAFVLDESGTFSKLVNLDGGKYARGLSANKVTLLKHLIAEHFIQTESAKARAVLDDWERYAPKFWEVSVEHEEVSIDQPPLQVVHLDRDESLLQTG